MNLQIKYNTSLISTLLDEVAVFSEENGGHQLEDERFSPNIVCQHCIDANRSMVHEGVRLSFRRELTDNEFVSADRHIVELIMNKLMQCACQFTEKGEITVGCHRGDPAHLIVFFVQDTGGGIPEDRRDILFKWFEDPDEMYEIGYEDCFFGNGVTLVEWADLIKELMPENTVWIEMRKDNSRGFDHRMISIKSGENK